MHRLRLLSLSAAAVVAATTSAASAQTLDSLTLAGLRWRTVGPANFEGRTTDVVGIPGPSKTFFVAAAGGGNYWTFDRTTQTVVHRWRPIDQI